MNLADLSIHAFILLHNIKNEKGDPIEFREHLFLFDIYRDRSQNIVVMKPAQVGASTMDVIKTLYDAHREKLDIIYTLPTDNDTQIFVGGKVNRIIAQNPIFQRWTKDKDTIEQKQIGNSMIYFRGTWTAKTAIMVSADRLVHDEIDSSKHDVVVQYQARLQHSKYKQLHIFSHPSLPGEGVDQYWQKSDQKHWIITCKECQQRQYLSWPESIDTELEEYVCKKCHAIIDSQTRRHGDWVPKYTDRKFSGYWVSLLMAPWVSAKEILEKYNDQNTTEEFFYNKVLGLPYVGSGNKVDKDIIMRNLTDEINKQEGTIIIGVDPGIDFRVVMGNDRGLFYYETLGKATRDYNPYDTLRGYLKRWPKSKIFIDQGGDIIGQRKLREEFPGRVFLCFYRRDKKDGQIFRYGKHEHEGDVYIDRNKAIQLVIDEFAEKRIPLQGTESDWYDFYVHWSNIYKTKIETDEGFSRWVWKRSNRDDLVHCCVYWRAGMAKFNGGQGKIFGSDKNRFIEGVEKGVTISPFDTISHYPTNIQLSDEVWTS